MSCKGCTFAGDRVENHSGRPVRYCWGMMNLVLDEGCPAWSRDEGPLFPKPNFWKRRLGLSS